MVLLVGQRDSRAGSSTGALERLELMCVFVLAFLLPALGGAQEYCAYVPGNLFTVADVAANAIAATAPPLSQNNQAIVLSPDGTRAYATNYDPGTVSVIDTATLGVIATIPVVGSAAGIAITPSGDEVYVANFVPGGWVSVISTATNTVTQSIAATTPASVAIAPDGKHAYVTSTGSTLSIIDTSTKAVTPISVDGAETRGVAVTPDSSHAYVTQFNVNRVAVVDTNSNTVTGFIPVGTHPNAGIAATPGGLFVYVANYDSDNVSVISTATNTVVATIPVGMNPSGVAVTPDGSEVYVINASPAGGVSVIDTATRTVTGTIPLPGGANSIAVGLIPTGCGVPSVSGRIRYYSADRPVADVTVQALGGVQHSTMSDATGAYGLAGLDEANWTIEPTKVGGRGEAISTLDASYVLQRVAGLRTFSPLQALACDVTGNGTISTLDAVRILQYVAGQRSRFEVADTCDSDWGFMPMGAVVPNQTVIPPLMAPGSCQRGAVQFAPLEGVAAGQDFLGFVFGDCTGNWLPESPVGALRR